ncbi:MAG: UDP-N-acetylmuramoyl-tripeptide--D-alanyl-D-alanine ligase [Hydrogenoanaerobacterium sp.]
MNMTLSLSAICEVICADKKPFGTISFVTTDSRDIRPGCLFVALHGEKFDGHSYINAALAAGAAYAVADIKGDYPADKVLFVGNTQSAFRRIAALYRLGLSAKIVAVTGSVGKTGTRDMAAAVLSAAYSTVKTQANLNNEIGVPQTVLSIESSHEAAVVEMGMSGFGEIEELSLCARPDIAIITNIGVSHIELLGSRAGIFKAKTEITSGLTAGAALVLCGDDDLLCTYDNPRFNIVRFGINNKSCDVLAENIKIENSSTSFEILYKDSRYSALIPALGRHNVLNALAGFTAGVLAGVAPHEAARALAGYSPTGMRQKMTKYGGVTVVEDCYNASPNSFAAALHTLSEMPCDGRRIVIAADMLELGDFAEGAHKKMGELAAKLKIDSLYAFGELSRQMVAAAKMCGINDAIHFKNKNELAEYIIRIAKDKDIIWFKASRGMKLEEVIKQFYEEWNNK